MDQESHPLKGLWAALSVAVLLSGAGCRTGPTAPSTPNARGIPAPTQPAPVTPSTPVPPAPPTPAPPPPRENHLSPATRSLVAQSRTLVSHGDLDGASSTLDRALRIEPNNPLVWIE